MNFLPASRNLASLASGENAQPESATRSNSPAPPHGALPFDTFTIIFMIFARLLRRPGLLSAALTCEYRTNSLQDNRAIEENRHVFQIKQIIFELAISVFDRRAVGILDLCPSG